MHRDLCTFWNSGLGPIPDRSVRSDPTIDASRLFLFCFLVRTHEFPTPPTLLPRLSYLCRILNPSLLFDTGSQPNILLSGRLLLTPTPPFWVPLLRLSLASPNPARQGQDRPWLSAALGPHGTRRKHPKSVRRIVPRIAYFLTRPLDKALATHIRFSRVNRSPSITESPATDPTTRQRNRSISTGTTTPRHPLRSPFNHGQTVHPSTPPPPPPLHPLRSGPAPTRSQPALRPTAARPIYESPRVTRRLTA